MSHPSIHRFVAEAVKKYNLGGRVLEVGSRDVNGGDPLFGAFPRFSETYLGIDNVDGLGVDKVCDAHDLPFVKESFDTVISSEMLEHDSAFWLSLPEMGRVLAQGGYLVLTARGNGCREHMPPHDYWRFMDNSVPLLYELAGVTLLEQHVDPECEGFFAVGVKA